jgi:predicted GNAT superfamily acetyltransferase
MCRPPPPLSPFAAAALVAVEELQGQLLAREEELTQREKALAMRVEKAKISKKAQVKVNADLNTERAKTEATRK